MGRDIYMRDPGSDPNYKDGILEVSDDIEMLIAEIKMMLYTNRGEVLGAPDFGANLEEMLFTFGLNEYSLRQMLRDQTLKFIPRSVNYGVDFDVKFARGTVRDMCLIDIFINNRPAFGVLIK